MKMKHVFIKTGLLAAALLFGTAALFAQPAQAPGPEGVNKAPSDNGGGQGDFRGGRDRGGPAWGNRDFRGRPGFDRRGGPFNGPGRDFGPGPGGFCGRGGYGERGGWQEPRPRFGCPGFGGFWRGAFFQDLRDSDKTTIEGTLDIVNGKIAVVADNTTYYDPGLRRWAGLIDGLKIGAAVKLEGWANPLPYAPSYAFFITGKLTLNGKDYTLLQY
jgi:hypothetical protein